MARFILETDYEMQIKQEIIRILTAQNFYNSGKLVRAEQTAIRQIRNRIGKRYDCDKIFAPAQIALGMIFQPPVELIDDLKITYPDAQDGWAAKVIETGGFIYIFDGYEWKRTIYLDTRDEWIVTITIDIALYHLYSQTGMKDIPQHRQDRYQDALDWLKDVGNGDSIPDLPPIVDEDGNEYSESIISSRPQENQRW